MHIEELVWISSSQLEGAGGPDRRGKVHQDKEVRRAVSQGARSCKGLFTHIAHQFNLLTDNEEAGESDQRNGSDPRIPIDPFFSFA